MVDPGVSIITDITFITAHFQDFDWIKSWVKRIVQFTDYNLIRELLIINQDRNSKSRAKLQALDPKVRVLEYPVNQKYFDKQGHDHAYVLNLATEEAQGQFVCIMDSDCHPFSSDWIKGCETRLQENDAVAAVDYYQLKNNSNLLTHPCFLLINRTNLDFTLSFDQDLFDHNMDTGRLIGKQLELAGRKVSYVVPKKAFRTYWGFIYIDSIYHHERGSYAKGDARLQKQIDWRQNFFKRIVIKYCRYDFNNIEWLYFRFRFLKQSSFHKTLKTISAIPKRTLSKIRQLFNFKNT